MNIRFNKNKSIGEVLYIVEGGKTESYIFLDSLFAELIENYDFNVDNAAIYYIFDRDHLSNTDMEFIKMMLSTLGNSRDNGLERQGLLLLSYPSVEAFTLSNFMDKSFDHQYGTGTDLKHFLHGAKMNQSQITEDTLKHAIEELMYAMRKMGTEEFDVDNFEKDNIKIFNYEEEEYDKKMLYRALSLLSISLIDLGVIEIDKEV